jgi:hypothetical protein
MGATANLVYSTIILLEIARFSKYAKNKISLRLFIKTSRNFTRVKVDSGGI